MISLDKLARAFEERFSECDQYLDIESGEVLNVPNSAWVFGQEEYDQMQSLIENDERYYAMPTDYELREKPIMKDFAMNYGNEHISEFLLSQIRRAHPYRCFKDALYRHGIEQEYYDFLHEAYISIAREWCEGMELEYFD